MMRLIVSHTDDLITLYIIAFALEIAGVTLVVLEIRNDIRAARAISEGADAPNPPRGVRRSAPGVEFFIGGALGASLAETAHSVDSFRAFTARRLSEGLARRAAGVFLFVVGASVGLAANLVSAL